MTNPRPMYGYGAAAPVVYVVQEQMMNGPFYRPDVEKRYTGTEWSDGLCSCCSDGCETCALSFCCACCMVAKIFSRIPPHVRLRIFGGCESPAGAGILVCALISVYCCTCGAPLVVFFYTMTEAIIARYRLREQPSCLRVCFCTGCVLAQAARHVNRAQGYTMR
jgi:Cys-rich protein (TIGR01571 family)